MRCWLAYTPSVATPSDWYLIGLSAGKNYYSLHICAADKGGYLAEQNAAKLGKVKAGRSCINFKKLEDLKLDVVIAIVKQAVKSGGLNAVGYALAVLTGLRRGELKRLLWADVHLDAQKPRIEVRAATTKNKRPATMFLVPQLVRLLEMKRGNGTGLVLPYGVPGVATLSKDLISAGVAVQDERGWRVDFHALRHTYASLLGAAGVSEGARVKMVRHSEWRQTDHYTDPSSVPVLAGMEKLALFLPSSLASQKSGKSGQNEAKPVQTKTNPTTIETVDIRGEMEVLANDVPGWENLELASPRGFEPRFSP
jgi:integrase